MINRVSVGHRAPSHRPIHNKKSSTIVPVSEEMSDGAALVIHNVFLRVKRFLFDIKGCLATSRQNKTYNHHNQSLRPETMVFVAAAAVSAGAYGAYKGGQAAVKGTKQKLNDIKLERNGKAEYNAKSKERASRLSAIEKKHSASATATASTSSAGAAGRSSASASASAPGGGGKSVEERLAERRSAKAAAAATRGTAGSKKKGSVLSRFKK